MTSFDLAHDTGKGYGRYLSRPVDEAVFDGAAKFSVSALEVSHELSIGGIDAND